MTWTSVYDPEDVFFQESGFKYPFTHSITAQGFDPSQDTLLEYYLTFTFYDDIDDDQELPEAVLIDPTGLEGDQRVDIGGDDVVIGQSTLGLEQLLQSRSLDVNLWLITGDFYFDKSVLTVNGWRNTPPDPVTPTPEPGALLLLGAGFAGLVYFRKNFGQRLPG